MPEGIAERYRRWLEYEQDAHAKVVRSLESVPEARRTSPGFLRAVGRVGHIAAARRMWLYRFGAAPGPPDAFFPEDKTLADIVTDLHDVHERWVDYLGRVSDEELGLVFEYQSLDAG